MSEVVKIKFSIFCLFPQKDLKQLTRARVINTEL